MFVIQKVDPEPLLKFFREEKERFPGEIQSNWAYASLWRKHLYTVTADGQVLGYAIVNEWGTDRKRLLDELYVSPDYRCLGLGRALFKFAQPGELIVDGGNERAIRFYQKMGMRKNGGWKYPNDKLLFTWMITA